MEGKGPGEGACSKPTEGGGDEATMGSERQEVVAMGGSERREVVWPAGSERQEVLGEEGGLVGEMGSDSDDVGSTSLSGATP